MSHPFIPGYPPAPAPKTRVIKQGTTFWTKTNFGVWSLVLSVVSMITILAGYINFPELIGVGILVAFSAIASGVLGIVFWAKDYSKNSSLVMSILGIAITIGWPIIAVMIIFALAILILPIFGWQ